MVWEWEVEGSTGRRMEMEMEMEIVGRGTSENRGKQVLFQDLGIANPDCPNYRGQRENHLGIPILSPTYMCFTEAQNNKIMRERERDFNNPRGMEQVLGGGGTEGGERAREQQGRREEYRRTRKNSLSGRALDIKAEYPYWGYLLPLPLSRVTHNVLP